MCFTLFFNVLNLLWKWYKNSYQEFENFNLVIMKEKLILFFKIIFQVLDYVKNIF